MLCVFRYPYFSRIRKSNGIRAYRTFDNGSVWPKRLWNCWLMKRRFCGSASSHWLVSLQRASARPSHPGVPISPAAAAPRQRGSPLLLRRSPAHAHAHAPAAQTSLLCSRREEEAVRASACEPPCVVSALRLGSGGEEPVVDSTPHREGAVHGGKNRLRNRNHGPFLSADAASPLHRCLFPRCRLCRGGVWQWGATANTQALLRHSLKQHPDAPDRPLPKIYAGIFQNCSTEVVHRLLDSPVPLVCMLLAVCSLPQAWHHSLFGDLVVNRNKRSLLNQVNDGAL